MHGSVIDRVARIGIGAEKFAYSLLISIRELPTVTYGIQFHSFYAMGDTRRCVHVRFSARHGGGCMVERASGHSIKSESPNIA